MATRGRKKKTDTTTTGSTTTSSVGKKTATKKVAIKSTPEVEASPAIEESVVGKSPVLPPEKVESKVEDASASLSVQERRRRRTLGFI